MGKKLEIKAGDKFGRWTVVQEVEPVRFPGGSSSRRFFCRCECGSVREVNLCLLRTGISRSCGCLSSEVHRELLRGKGALHGLSTKHKELYSKITDAIYRCSNPENSSYENYGGRGIKVCDEWINDKEKFVEWALSHGFRHGLDLDRKDNLGDYTPENCRFVDRRTNLNNRRCTRKHAGTPLADIYRAAKAPAVGYATFSLRVIEYGWDVERALTTPSRSQN